jgi:hypothetical protein
MNKQLTRVGMSAKDKNTTELAKDYIDPDLFYYTGELEDEYKSIVKSKINDHVQKAVQLLTPVKDKHYSNILNLDSNNKWFNDNVAFLFSLGCIFDENDRKYINEIIDVFTDNKHSGFLKNYYRIASYTDDMIKAAEKKLAVENGNYHILLIVLVFDGADFENAPETEFKRAGIIQHFLEWKHVVRYISMMIARYGLISNIQTPHDRESWEILEGKSLGNSARELFDIELDGNSVSIKDFDSIENIKRELAENFPSRATNKEVSRTDKSKKSMHNRLAKHPSLMTRVNELTSLDNSQEEGIKDHHKAVQFRFNEGKPLMKDNYVEFQLFDADNTYSLGKNVVAQGEIGKRSNLPRFELMSRKINKKSY